MREKCRRALAGGAGETTMRRGTDGDKRPEDEADQS